MIYTTGHLTTGIDTKDQNMVTQVGRRENSAIFLSDIITPK